MDLLTKYKYCDNLEILYSIDKFNYMLNQLNASIFTFINQFADQNPILDQIEIAVGQYLPFLFILMLVYLWFKKDDKQNNFKHTTLYAGYATVLGLITNYVIGLFYFHPRPFMDHLGTTLAHHSAQSSFPSDHTTFMLSMALMLLYFKPTKRFGLVFILLGLWGGISRVFIGVHYPFDILGSILVSTFSSYFIFIISQYLKNLNNIIINIYQNITKINIFNN